MSNSYIEMSLSVNGLLFITQKINYLLLSTSHLVNTSDKKLHILLIYFKKTCHTVFYVNLNYYTQTSWPGKHYFAIEIVSVIVSLCSYTQKTL